MYATRLTLAVFVVLALAEPAEARSNFNRNVCTLLSAKQVTAVPGVSTNCTNAKPSRGLGATNYIGNWAGKTPRSARLQVTVSLYTDTGALQLARRNLKQGLPGPPRKVAGIGSAAYEAIGALSSGVHFATGKYVVYVSLNTIGSPPRSTVSIEGIAKAIASKL